MFSSGYSTWQSDGDFANKTGFVAFAMGSYVPMRKDGTVKKKSCTKCPGKKNFSPPPPLPAGQALGHLLRGG